MSGDVEEHPEVIFSAQRKRSHTGHTVSLVAEVSITATAVHISPYRGSPPGVRDAMSIIFALPQVITVYFTQSRQSSHGLFYE
ncbi:MAG: hypothetical protein KF861_14575 [Planctomycetaceae bacterium]|nr:hypothetical protein [Planctomycetaceae bacterium]